MKRIMLILLISGFILSCAKKKVDDQSTTVPIEETPPDVLVLEVPPDSVVNRSFVSANGERFLQLELIVPASLDSVWDSFSTEAGVKTWMAPVSNLDFKIGGIMKNHMNYKKNIGDKGTLTLKIQNYVPREMVTYKIELDEYFGSRCGKEDENLQEIIQLKSIDKNRTKITSRMVGWGEGPDWDKAYDFFSRGNKWCYDVMLKRFKTGPIDWPKDPCGIRSK